MKLYVSEKSQFGKELSIANEIVKFNPFGVAEVSNEQGKKIIEYSNWYSDKPFDFSKNLKEAESKLESKVENEGVIAELKLKLEDAKNLNESRVQQINQLKTELADFVKALGEEVEKRKALEIELADLKAVNEKEKEVLNFKAELAKQSIDELKQTCASLDIEEEKYVKLRSADKIIEVIVNNMQ